MEKVRLEVSGMNCTACSVSVEKKILEAGAIEVHVDFTSGEASFMRPEGISTDLIVRGIESLGYMVPGYHRRRGIFLPDYDGYFLVGCSLLTFPLLMHMFVDSALLMNPFFQFAICLPVFVFGLLRFGKGALNSTLALAPNMDVLILTGASAAFFYSLLSWIWFASGSHPVFYFETTASVITLVLLGNFLEHRTIRETTTALRELVAMRPTRAKRVSLQFGEEVTTVVEAKEIVPGDLIVVVSGEQIAADGRVLRGSGLCDESLISGESLPSEKFEGSQVFGGTHLEQGTLLIRVEKSGNASILDTIIEQVKQAQREKPSIQKLGDRISQVFVPVVILLSLLTFLIAHFFFGVETGQALMSAIAVLVISCPCALGLATPTAVMAGIGRATRAGILIRGGQTLEQLSEIKIVVFDKTGTLTDGQFSMDEIIPTGHLGIEEIQAIVGRMERHSDHPIARSVSSWYDLPCQYVFEQVSEQRGFGLTAIDQYGHSWMLGSSRSMHHIDLKGLSTCDLFLSCDNHLIAAMRISDRLRPGAEELMKKLREQGKHVVMISGDRELRCSEVASRLGIKEFYSDKLPHEKTELLKHLRIKGKLAMVGDGINDAPALAVADVGISLSGATEIAIKTSQVVLMQQGNLNLLEKVFSISKASMQTIRQNLFFSFFYNVLAIPVAAAGFLSPVIGALAMALSDVVVVGNSIRLKFRSLP